MPKKQTDEGLRREFMRELRDAGNNPDILAQKLHIDPDIVGLMADQARAGRVPITGDTNQDWLRGQMRNEKTDWFTGKGELTEVRKKEGENYIIRDYRIEVGKRIPADIEGKYNIGYQVMIHGKDRGGERWLFTGVAADGGSAMALAAGLMGNYDDFEADDIELRTFEDVGEE